MNQKTYECNQLKITPDEKEATIYIRFLDLALMNTNIHAFLPPRTFRRPADTTYEHNIIKINLNQIQDVLPPIKKEHRCYQKEWRTSWSKFINQIYEHSLRIKEHQAGHLWLNNPSTLLDSLDTFFPTCKEMTSYKKFVKQKLELLVKQRTEPTIIQRIKFLRNLIRSLLEKHKHLERIRFYAPYLAGDLLLEALKEEPYLRKVQQITLLDPITELKNSPHITYLREDEGTHLIVLKSTEKYPFQETKINVNTSLKLSTLSKKKIVYYKNTSIPTGGRIINPALEQLVKELAI